MPKFFLPPEDIHENFMTLTGENYTHARVLRLKSGDAVTICDGLGTDYRCAVSNVSSGCISLVVHASAAAEAESAVACRIYMAFAKADKLEHVMQKATELGASEIIAFPSERCVSRPDSKSLEKKLDRWQKIAASAAAQSGRGRIPVVRALSSYDAALDEAARADLAVLFYENEMAHTFRAAIETTTPFKTATLVTGPEGGFTPSEVEAAKRSGLRICTLGRRILRCETAPLCALSALMYASGEF